MEVVVDHEKELQHEIFDKYATHKSISQNLLNTSIIQSHFGTLVSIFSEKGSEAGLDKFDIATIILVSISILLQLIIFFMITWVSYYRPDYSSGTVTASGVNFSITFLSGIALIINIAITTVSS